MKCKKSCFNPFSWTFLLTCLLLPILTSGLGAESITLTLKAGDFRLESTTTGETQIIMLSPGYGTLQSPADPLLPQRIIPVDVPQNANLSDLTLSIDNQEIIDLTDPVNLVAQPPDRFAQLPPGLVQPVPPDLAIIPKFFGFDKSIVNDKNILVYGKDAFFPAKAIELLPTITQKIINVEEGLRSSGPVNIPTFTINKVIRVLYKPFLYNPVQRKLRLINKATITLTYNIVIPIPAVASTKVQANAAPQAGAIADYVIITSSSTVANSTRLADFVRMKQLAGHTVRIVTENDFNGLTGQAPNGTAEKIRQWLINNYIPLGIDYVLLIGNPDPDDPLDSTDSVGDIPMKMCFPLYFEPFYRESPTDYFYADLTGNWDLDGNQIYGVDIDRTHAESPDPSIAPDTFSAIWTGKINIDFNENYTFSTFSDDGVQVFLDGNLIIDNFTLHPPTYDSSAPQLMTTGQHDITVKFFENTVHAVMKLYWQTSNSSNVGLQIIPSDHLFFDNGGGTFVSGGLKGTYFNTADLTGPVALTRTDPTIDFIWGTGDNGPGGREPGAEVFVGRIPVYNNNYTDLDSILGKIISYETDPGDISWRSSILLPMKPSDPNTNGTLLGEGIRNDYALAAGFKVFRIYDADYSSTGGPTPELFPCNVPNVLGEWQKDYGMVTWWTHGWSQGAVDVFDSTNAPNLDNTKPSFTFQTSCSNGEPEDTNNLGYALLKNGAVATVSATRVSWYGGGTNPVNQPTNDINECFAYSYTKKIIDDGLPLSAGVGLATTKGDFTAIHMNGMDYNLYGDPDCFLLQTNPNQPPVANANGPYTANEGSSITLTGAGSFDPEGDALLYRWDLNNDGSFDTAFSASPIFVLTSGDNFVRTVKLQVRDSLGLTGEATALVTFLNVNPSASINSVSQPNPFAIFTGQSLTMIGSFTDPGWLDTHTSTWDFGDGTTASGTLTEENIQPDATGTTTVTKAYTRPGTYTITLTIRDDDGGIGTATKQIIVLGNMQTTGSIILADRSKLLAPGCSGGTFTEVGADSLIRTTTLLVNGNVSLRSRARIEGNVEISGTVQRQDSTVITGTVQERVPVTIGANPTFTVTVGTADLTVNNDQTSSWTPGNYRDGMVRARGRVTLSAGTYNFRNLTIEPDTVMTLNTTSGPIIINVDQQLGFGDRSARVVNGNANNIFIYCNSNNELRIGTDNQLSVGSIIAPKATVHVNSRSTVKGPICANLLRTEPDCTIDCTP